MLLVRGLPLRAGGRQMSHGRKGCGRTDKEKLRGASRRQHKRERRGVCVYPSWAVSMPLCIRPARVGCLPSAARMITAVDYTRTSGVFFFGGLGFCPFFFLCCTYVPRVCRVIPCPISLVRASCIACHGSTAQQQSAKTGNTTKRSRVSNSRTITGLSDGFNPCAIPA